MADDKEIICITKEGPAGYSVDKGKIVHNIQVEFDTTSVK